MRLLASPGDSGSPIRHAKLQVAIDYRPVHMQPLDAEMDHVPPKARVY
jgi:succinate dehydrogenase / fumarate reductase flavoprotein subunit